MHHFLNVGLYDGLFVMQDVETETLWSHITGEALYGKMLDHQMPISNLLQMNVALALEMDPDMPVAISDYVGGRVGPDMGPGNEQAQLRAEFSQTLGSEDTRRERMEVGLGLWSDTARKYYPFSTLRDAGRVIIDEFDGRRLVVYVDPLSATPAAAFVDAAEAQIEGREVVFNDGRRIRAGQLIDRDEKASALDRPNQIFTRWYGYSLTFPEADIYGE